MPTPRGRREVKNVKEKNERMKGREEEERK